MFFKSTANTKLEEVRRYIPVSLATTFSNISPFIQSAEINYILPLLGQPLYDLVMAFYLTPSPLPTGITSGIAAKYTILLEHIQRSLINLTYWASFDFMNVLMNDSGFHRQESDTEKSLFKYQEDSLKAGFKNNGFDGLDTMLEFIEANMAAFPLFAESPNYTGRKASIIPNTAVFNKIFNINNSRLVFLKISRYITQVEDFEIQAVLGASLYAKVKSELAKELPDAKVAALLPYIQKPLAHLSIARAGFTLGVNITDKGLFFESQNATQQNSQVTTPLSDQQYFTLSRFAETTGLAYMDMLTGFLSANPADYPEFNPPGGSPFIRSNTDRKTTWV
ncbi:MAG: hypothetical protein NTV01_03385 [Bacteroidia bacterium]|nr:hypothetical protein [Bacteroidia bacterium]